MSESSLSLCLSLSPMPLVCGKRRSASPVSWTNPEKVRAEGHGSLRWMIELQKKTAVRREQAHLLFSAASVCCQEERKKNRAARNEKFCKSGKTSNLLSLLNPPHPHPATPNTNLWAWRVLRKQAVATAQCWPPACRCRRCPPSVGCSPA